MFALMSRLMKPRPILALALCLLPTLAGVAGADGKSQNGADVIQQAETKMDIFALPSFEMKANVRIDNQGKPLDGSYVLLWNGSEQWREEITFPGYSEVQVGGKGMIFIKRSTEFLPLRIDQLHSALGFGSSPPWGSFFHLELRPGEALKKTHDRRINGAQARCLDIIDQGKSERTVCVDSSTGTFVRESKFRDTGLVPIGPKVFPQSVSWTENGKPLAEADIGELKPLVQTPPNAFGPPQGAVARIGCMNPFPWRRIHSVPPKYPEQDRQSHVQGSVAVYAVIAKDGVPQGLRVVNGISSGLNQASMEAIQQWRYEPATCDGVPVDVETTITVNYVLSY